MENLNRDEEYSQAVREYMQFYRELKRYYDDIREWAHFSVYGGNYIKIVEFVADRPLKTLVYVKTDKETGDLVCYQMATDRIKELIRRQAAKG